MAKLYHGSTLLIDGDNGGGANPDNKSITENTNEEIQTIGIIDSNNTTNAIKTWTGTKAQYDALKVAHIMYQWEDYESSGISVYTETSQWNINFQDPVYDSSYNIIGRVTYLANTSGDSFMMYDGSDIRFYRPDTDESTTTIYENRIDPNTLYNITDDTDVSLTILEALYPIGSVYMTTNATCPLQGLGIGTWTQETSRELVEKKEPDANDPSWYNLYSDGWCEQGGYVDRSITSWSGDSVITVTFEKPFAEKTYYSSSQQTFNVSTWQDNTNFTRWDTSTATTMDIFVTGNSNCTGVFWQACGYTSTTTTHKRFRRVS